MTQKPKWIEFIPLHSTAEEAKAHWGASIYTNNPIIQPHELDEYEGDIASLIAAGFCADTAEREAKQNVMMKRKREYFKQRVKKAAHSERSRNGAAVVNADHVELHSQYQAEVDKLMQFGDPAGMKYLDACSAVALSLGVGATTVRNHTENKWPRKGGRPKKT